MRQIQNHQSRKTGKGLQQSCRIRHISSYSAINTESKRRKGEVWLQRLHMKWLICMTIPVWEMCLPWVKFGQEVYDMQKNVASFLVLAEKSCQPVSLSINEERSSPALFRVETLFHPFFLITFPPFFFFFSYFPPFIPTVDMFNIT